MSPSTASPVHWAGHGMMETWRWQFTLSRDISFCDQALFGAEGIQRYAKAEIEQATGRAPERGFIMNKRTYLWNETFELALKDLQDFSRSKASYREGILPK